MRRAVVTFSATAAGVILLLSLKPHTTTTSAAGRVISSGDTSATDTPSGSPSASSSASGSSGSSGSVRTITGSSVDTRYGPVQVRVTVNSSKKITKIDVIQYPSQSGRDQEINSYALPQLNQEAIAAQSANIDAVSGATYTSDGYTQSLQSALDKA